MIYGEQLSVGILDECDESDCDRYDFGNNICD